MLICLICLQIELVRYRLFRPMLEVNAHLLVTLAQTITKTLDD